MWASRSYFVILLSAEGKREDKEGSPGENLQPPSSDRISRISYSVMRQREGHFLRRAFAPCVFDSLPPALSYVGHNRASPLCRARGAITPGFCPGWGAPLEAGEPSCGLPEAATTPSPGSGPHSHCLPLALSQKVLQPTSQDSSSGS